MVTHSSTRTVTTPTTTTGPGPGSGVYPMPAREHDPRFTFGLISDVGKVLAAHGFPPIRTGTDHVRLQQALFDFLYTSAPAAAGVSPRATTPAGPGTPGEPAGAATPGSSVALTLGGLA